MANTDEYSVYVGVDPSKIGNYQNTIQIQLNKLSEDLTINPQINNENVKKQIADIRSDLKDLSKTQIVTLSLNSSEVNNEVSNLSATLAKSFTDAFNVDVGAGITSQTAKVTEDINKAMGDISGPLRELENGYGELGKATSRIAIALGNVDKTLETGKIPSSTRALSKNLNELSEVIKGFATDTETLNTGSANIQKIFNDLQEAVGQQKIRAKISIDLSSAEITNVSKDIDELSKKLADQGVTVKLQPKIDAQAALKTDEEGNGFNDIPVYVTVNQEYFLQSANTIISNLNSQHAFTAIKVLADATELQTSVNQTLGSLGSVTGNNVKVETPSADIGNLKMLSDAFGAMTATLGDINTKQQEVFQQITTSFTEIQAASKQSAESQRNDIDTVVQALERLNQAQESSASQTTNLDSDLKTGINNAVSELDNSNNSLSDVKIQADAATLKSSIDSVLSLFSNGSDESTKIKIPVNTEVFKSDISTAIIDLNRTADLPQVNIKINQVTFKSSVNQVIKSLSDNYSFNKIKVQIDQEFLKKSVNDSIGIFDNPDNFNTVKIQVDPSTLHDSIINAINSINAGEFQTNTIGISADEAQTLNDTFGSITASLKDVQDGLSKVNDVVREFSKQYKDLGDVSKTSGDKQKKSTKETNQELQDSKKVLNELFNTYKKLDKAQPGTSSFDYYSQKAKECENAWDKTFDSIKNESNRATIQQLYDEKSAKRDEQNVDQLLQLLDKLKRDGSSGSINSIEARMNTYSDAVKDTKEYKALEAELENVKSKATEANSVLIDDAPSQAIREKNQALNKEYQQLNENSKAVQDINRNNISFVNGLKQLESISSSVASYMNKYGNSIKSNTALYKEFENLQQDIFSGNIDSTDAEQTFEMLKFEAQAAGVEVQTLGSKLRELFSRRLSTQLVSRGIGLLMSSLKKVYQNVLDVDTAMTELRKVTDETEDTYIQFLDDAADRAKYLGATLEEVVNATADFARLNNTGPRYGDIAVNR